MLTKDRLEQMKEAELIKEVLIPLLKAMGYQDVFDHQGGAPEQGKDVVCWKQNEIGARSNLALVVKAVPITGRAAIGSGTTGEIQTQIQQCFGKPFLDPITAEERQVHQCWVVTNKRIIKEAEDAIASALHPSGLDRSVSFVGGDKLWELVERYLPIQSVWQKLEEAGRVLEGVDTHYRPEIRLSSSGLEIGVTEKFPGAANEKPFTVSTVFAFPDTPEGRAVQEALDRAIKTGAPVEVPSPFIHAVELPAFFTKLIGSGEFKPDLIQISPAPGQRPLLVRLELQCDDGDTFILEEVSLRISQAGTEEITLVDNGLSTPIKTKLILRPKNRTGSITFEFSQRSINVKQLLSELKLRTCLGKPTTVRVVHAETGITLFESRLNAPLGEAPDPRFVDAIRDLCAIQIKLKQPITIPYRDFTDEEARLIAHLRTILHEGKLKGKWSGVAVSLLPEGCKNVLETFGGGKIGWLRLGAYEVAHLFDVHLQLGKVRSTLSPSKLANDRS